MVINPPESPCNSNNYCFGKDISIVIGAFFNQIETRKKTLHKYVRSVKSHLEIPPRLEFMQILANYDTPIFFSRAVHTFPTVHGCEILHHLIDGLSHYL